MSKTKKEEIIRNNLKQNLGIIEKGLELIDDEYHLKNPNGASGFLDIYASDQNNNLVIIELKRSNAASREAITELSKYIALLRRAKNVKNSEVRLLVISTEWHELLVPFSEFYHATNYQLEGYLLKTNANFEPIGLERISPLPQLKGRKLCRRHFIRYYKTNEDLKNAEEIVAEKAKNLGIEDFILANFKLNFKDEYYGATRVLYWAQQLKTSDFYLSKLTQNLDNENLQEIFSSIEDLDDDDALDELADRLDDEIMVKNESCEIGYPEKLVQRVDSGLWSLDNISKYGVFKEDERLNDELLMNDLKGLTGTSFMHYFASTRTNNRSKVNEINETLDSSLFYNDNWKHAIKDIIEYSSQKTATITLSIFNKDDILETIWAASIGLISKGKPSFFFILDQDSNGPLEIFEGNLVWDKTDFNLNNVIEEVFGDFKSYLFERHFGGHRAFDYQIMSLMGFSYTVNHYMFEGNNIVEKRNIKIRGQQVVELNSQEILQFSDFVEIKSIQVSEIAGMFQNHHAGDGVFFM